jgi:membrane fusion protein, heavy metal efflux system
MNTKQVISVYLLFGLFMNSCNQIDGPHVILKEPYGQVTAVRLSSRKISQAGIEFGQFQKQIADKWIPCSGFLINSAGNIVNITSPADGVIEYINYHSGDYIKSGSLLAGLQNIDFIKLQQDYLEAKNQYEFLREDYKRQGELAIENATSIKKMQIAKRDYQSAELLMHSLRLQLETLGIETDSLRPDHLSPAIQIINKHSGRISLINILPGSYIRIGEKICEIVQPQPLVLKLNVSEKFAPFVKKGQLINFYLPFDSLSAFQAKILSDINSIDSKNQMAEIFASITNSDKNFIPGMSVTARIKVGTDSVYVVKSQSVFGNNSEKYLFMMDNGYFIKIPVKIGTIIDGYAEILNLPGNIYKDTVVTRGFEYLSTLFKP